MTKRGQSIEANFLHEPRVWRTLFLCPRRSDILCRSRILPKVCWHELGKLIFSTFSLTIFRTRFWHLGTCHVDVQQIRIECLGKLLNLDQNWGSYGLDNQNILNCQTESKLHIPNREFTIPEMRSALGIRKIFIVKAIIPSILVRFQKTPMFFIPNWKLPTPKIIYCSRTRDTCHVSKNVS